MVKVLWDDLNYSERSDVNLDFVEVSKYVYEQNGFGSG